MSKPKRGRHKQYQAPSEPGLYVGRPAEHSQSWWRAFLSWFARVFEPIAARWSRSSGPDDEQPAHANLPTFERETDARKEQGASSGISVNQYADLWQRGNAFDKRVEVLERRIEEMRRRIDELADLVAQARSDSGPRMRASAADSGWSTQGTSFDSTYRGEATGPEPRSYDAAVEGRGSPASDVAEELMNRLDETALTDQQALDWVAERGARGEVVSQSGSGPYDWRLLRVARGDNAVIVPNLRRPMGQTPLREYFELSAYNGVDALKKHHVRALPQQRRDRGTWHTLQPGRIHG